MIKLTDIFHSVITEKSLSKMWRYVTQPGNFAIISAARPQFSQDENNKRHRELLGDIRKMGYGYVELDGGYTYVDNRTGEEKIDTERSVFIPKMSLTDATSLGAKFEQETVLVNSGNDMRTVFPATKTTDISFNSERGMTFDPEAVKHYYSQFHHTRNANSGKKFAFSVKENFVLYEQCPPGKSEAMRLSKTGEYPSSKWIRVI